MNFYGNIKFSTLLIISIISILISSCPVFPSSVSLTAEEQQWLAEHKTIRVSGPQAFPPFQFFNENGEYVGIATDYIEYIAKQLGIRVEYLPKTSWPKILELIENKEIDVLSCAAYTEERNKYMLFSDPHITFPLVIVSRKDGPTIRKMQDIEGMRIALVKKISTEASLKKSQITFTPHYISSPKDALRAVSLSQADIAVENLAAASYIIDQEGYTNLKIAASTNFKNYALSIAIRKDWHIFQSIVNKSLSTISEQQHRDLRQQWFSVRYEHGITFFIILKWIALSLILLSGVIGTIVLWNRRLVKEIGERTKIELRLRESERKLSTLIGNLPGMAYRCRNETNWPMEFISNGCFEVTGYLPSDISGESSKQYGDIIHPDDRQYVWDTVQESINTNTLFEMEYRIVAKSGTTKWVWERGGLVSDIQTDDIYLEGFIADITQQKILSDQLQQSQKMEALGTLAGGIAHDFNNILASVIGYTELALSESEPGSNQENDLREVYAAGTRAKELVKQILAFARKSDEALKPVQISTITKEVIKFIRASIPTTIEIKHNIASDSYIMGSATQIHQIMMNLCTNAAQAMEDEGGTLELTLKEITVSPHSHRKQLPFKPGNYIEIKVSDTGHGIEPHIIDKVFEPYFTTKAPGKGTGMGLAMVQGIVETYGGKILVESTLRAGTLFTIYLPIARGSNKNQKIKSMALPSGHERILFIDDEAPIAKMGSRMLEQLGYSVKTMTSSTQALELFKSNPNAFDLVISDITMPNLTGDQLAQTLMQIRPEMPVILCTGYSNKLSEANASEIGVSAFIYKPITKEDLAQTVWKVLNAG